MSASKAGRGVSGTCPAPARGFYLTPGPLSGAERGSTESFPRTHWLRRQSERHVGVDMNGELTVEHRDATGIVVGQHVTDEKLQLARDLRRQMTPAERKVWAA